LATSKELVAADATVLSAAIVSWHERHEPAVSALEAALARKALILPSPVILEAYAALTALPAQHRLSPADAFHLLRSSFGTVKTVGPKTRDVWSVLRKFSVVPLGGSDVYDAMIVDIARDAGAKMLLTFRRAELERLAGAGLEIVEPV
jgi:predicted nucleic acid-binding protein